MKRILLSWSSGKDSAWSLHVLRLRGEYEVVGLLTTFNEVADRVAMHAVRRELVEWQAAAAGLPAATPGTERFVFLLTDGFPNCNPVDPCVADAGGCGRGTAALGSSLTLAVLE